MCDKDYRRQKNKATLESTDKLLVSLMLKLWRITALWELRTFSVANNLHHQIRRNHWGINEQERRGAGHPELAPQTLWLQKQICLAQVSAAAGVTSVWKRPLFLPHLMNPMPPPSSSSAHICYRVTSERISHWAHSLSKEKNKTSQIDLLLAQGIFFSSLTFS